MIPLRLKIDSTASSTFVTRIRRRKQEAASAFDAFLLQDDMQAGLYAGPFGEFRVFGISSAELDGDVLLLNPAKSVAHRLIRATSRHNTFLVTERCDQLCVMCSQPPKDYHVDMFGYFEQAALLAPPGSVIGLSGGEPTLHKAQLFSFLERMQSERADLRFHVLTNGQHFTHDDANALGALDGSGILWGIPLYAWDAETHDQIVGKDGAHALLIENLAILGRVGAAIELRTVIMRPNAPNLPRLAQFIVAMLPYIESWAIMQLENIGFGRKNWKELFFDSSAAFDAIGRAVDLARSRGIDAELYNFPLCTVPQPYRALAPDTISDWKQKFLSECTGCRLRDQCCGLFAWHPEPHGYVRFGLP